jgi:hypothetical protein
MLRRIISHTENISPWKVVLIINFLGGVSSCGTVPSITPTINKAETQQTVIAGVFTPTPQVPEYTPIQKSETATMEIFSSDQLGLCFSYPRGYTQLPYNETVEIIAPEIPGSGLRVLFWLEISDAYNRSAEKIADQEITLAGVDVDRWTVKLDGEEAVVLDGMPGQDLQRRVYVVHQHNLYVLAFMPTQSENKAANDEMEILYAAVTNSWTWSPCS